MNIELNDLRLQTARNIWLATASPACKPHLVPVWFVIWQNNVWIRVQSTSVKARNLSSNPRVMLSLEDGDKPFVLAGAVSFVEPPAEVVHAFKQKYDWDILSDAEYNTSVQIRPTHQVM